MEKNSLRKLEFPNSAKEALVKIGVNETSKPLQHNLSFFFSFRIFCYKSNKNGSSYGFNIRICFL